MQIKIFLKPYLKVVSKIAIQHNNNKCFAKFILNMKSVIFVLTAFVNVYALNVYIILYFRLFMVITKIIMF